LLPRARIAFNRQSGIRYNESKDDSSEALLPYRVF